MNDLRIGVVSEIPKDHFPFWNDGLRAALDHLNTQYNWEVSVFNIPSMGVPNVPDDLDFYLFWGALARPQHERKRFKHQGLLFAGGPTYHPNMKNFDVILAESRVDVEDFQKFGLKTVQAFGTNTKLFRPMPEMPKVFDYLYPAAFALWKRHDRFADYINKRSEIARSLAVGYMQPDGWEKECYEVCLNNGIAVMPQVSAEALSYLYNMSHNVLITADPDGGCQRAVLEGKASGVNVIIQSESEKLRELDLLTREDVLRDWSEVNYAEKIKQAIEEVFSEQH